MVSQDLISSRPSVGILPPANRTSISLLTEAMGSLGMAVVVVVVVVLGGCCSHLTPAASTRSQSFLPQPSNLHFYNKRKLMIRFTPYSQVQCLPIRRWYWPYIQTFFFSVAVEVVHPNSSWSITIPGKVVKREASKRVSGILKKSFLNPYLDPCIAAMAPGKPSIWQATFASFRSHSSSQMPPHTPRW